MDQTNDSQCEQYYQMSSLNDSVGQQLPVPSAKPYPPRHFTDFASPYSAKNMVVESELKHHIILGQGFADDREWNISTDHCYARPWNWRPESSFLRPTKTLFVRKQHINKQKTTNPLAPVSDCDDVIDVDGLPEGAGPLYDVPKAKQLMDECENYASLARGDDAYDDWEENIQRNNWTANQHRIFTGIANILNNDYTSRLAYCGVDNEPIMRRTVVDKSVQRFRRLLATVAWDAKLVQWLHFTLIDNLNKAYLAIYLDILQTLKSKLPTFIDKMMYGPSSSSRLGMLSNENLFPLLKRQWDPITSSLQQDKPKKLPSNPVLIVVPSSSTMPKRVHRWLALLSNLASVVTIPVNLGSTSSRMTMINYLDQMYATTRAKIQELKVDYPGRNIVLIGFNAGATLALQVAQVDPVLCVVCLGFSLFTADGKRGDPEDTLLELQSPALFVIGQFANTASQEEMEDLREKMRVETGLIVVGSADDYLRVSKKKKKLEGITQSIVDRYIVDEVGEFISGIILSPYPPHIRQSPTHVPTDTKKIKIERKRYNSNASSLDSEPPSPTPRITRPAVGRPPGSKSKTKLEMKWANQGIPSSPTSSNSPPPVLAPITTDTSSNDSSNVTDKPEPIKKIKTLKPTLIIPSPERPKLQSASVTPTSSPVKHIITTSAPVKAHGYSYPGRMTIPPPAIPTYSQTGIKTIPPMNPKTSGTSSIKVLESVTLNPSNSKYISTLGRTIDLSKVTLVNSMQTKTSGALGNVLLLPDGKIKAVTSSSKGGKIITSKKQLLGNRPPKPIKKISYIPHQQLQTALPPPTNLTTQDIMDLPIIFADDNQILDTTTVQSEVSQAPPSLTSGITSQHAPPQAKIITSAGNKFVVLNKQITSQSRNNFIITNSNIRKVPSITTVRNPKYTKIILSKRDEPKTSVMAHISNLSPEISVRKIVTDKPMQAPQQPPPLQIPLAPPTEAIDPENELIATAVPKPNLASSDVKNITVFNKKSPDTIKSQLLTKPVILVTETAKRSASEAGIIEDEFEPKQIKVASDEQ